MILDTLVGYLNRYSPVLVQTPWIGTIGNCAEEIYFGLLKARRERKRVCLLFPKDGRGWFRFSRKRANEELPYVYSSYRLLSEHDAVVRIAEWVISIGYYGLRLLSHLLTLSSRLIGRCYRFREDCMIPSLGQRHLWWPDGVAEFDRAKVLPFDWRGQLAMRLPIEVPASHNERAERIREQLGLPRDGWFVCLHVREAGYHGDYAEGYYRNATVTNYLKAIGEIVRRGGWVVRLGDPTMVRLPEMEHVVDYAHSRYKCDLMDIYLIKESSLYIGSQSGIWDVAELFQKPILMPNMCEWSFIYPPRQGDLGILKQVYSKSKKRFLSIQETLAVTGRCQYIFSVDDDYVFHENSPDEIFSLVQEYYRYMDSGISKLSCLQTEYNSRRVSETYKILEAGAIWTRRMDDVYNKYRIASRLEGCAGAISDTFLTANWERSARHRENAGVP